MNGFRIHALGVLASCLCAVALAGCATTSGTGQSLSGKLSAGACALVTPAEVARAFGANVGTGLPEQDISTDPIRGAAPGCTWPMSPEPVPTTSLPRPAITAGEIATPPSGGGGVVVWLNNADFPQLRSEVGHKDGRETATAVVGLGDEAIMLAIGDDWRELFVRKGSTTVWISAGRPGLVGPMLEAAERALGELLVDRI